MTLILTLAMTATAFAAAPQAGSAGITWTTAGGPAIVPDPPPAGFPEEYKQFLNPHFNFGEVEISNSKTLTPASINDSSTPPKGKKAGLAVDNPTSDIYTIRVKMGGFYKSGDTTQYMLGTTLTLSNPVYLPAAAASWDLEPQSGKTISPHASGLVDDGATEVLAKVKQGLSGMNWEAALSIPPSAVKPAGAVSAVLNWEVALI